MSTIQNVSSPFSPSIDSLDDLKSKAVAIVDFFAKVHKDWQVTKKNWHAQTIAQLDAWEYALDKKIPNFPIQDTIDKLGRNLEKKFAPFTEFNRCLDSNGHGSFFQQLATFLVKLPARAVRNIVKALYDIVRTSIYAAVHPIKALNQLAKLLVTLAHELTKPENWTKIGAGMIGACAGQSLVTANPLSTIGIGIGTAMLIGGLSVGALEAALEAEEGMRGEAALQSLEQQVKEIPEAMLTGFLLGLLLGGVRRFAEAKPIALTVEVTHHQPIPPIEPPIVELPVPIPTDIPTPITPMPAMASL